MIILKVLFVASLKSELQEDTECLHLAKNLKSAHVSLFVKLHFHITQLFFLTASVRFDFLYPNSKHCNRSIIFDGHLKTNAALIFINKAK